MTWIVAGLIAGVAVAAVVWFVPLIYGGVAHRPGKNLVVALFFVPVVIGLVAASITQVDTGEIAVMTRFGKVTGQEVGEGLHLKMPIDQANIYDVKVQKQEAEAAAASKDLQDINAKLILNYHVEAGRVSHVHQTVGVKYHDKLIAPALQEIFKATTAKFDATQLITDRQAVKVDAVEQVRSRLEKYGVMIDDLSIVDFSFSSEFGDAIESKQVAQQNAERARFNLQAAEIDAKAQEVQAKTLSSLYLQKQAIEKWDGHMPTYMGDGTVFNIPLKQ